MSDMKLSDELVWRGMIKDRTFDDLTWLNTPRTFYLGSDASSNSLTIGNLAVYVMARILVNHGWKPVMLFGGATSLIGDPGGKDAERELKPHDEIAKNVAGVKEQVKRLLAGQTLETVDNYDWFKDLGYLEFLRDVGKHYSMTELLQREYITARLGEDGSGISYAEFSYSLIQGYDYWWLYKNKGVELQIGGSDQWGNMLSGVPLIRKKEGVEVHCLSMPLIIDRTTGKKFGKSEAGAIWLDEKKTSVYQFYQFWLNIEDDSAEEFLKRYTLLDKPAIERVMQEFEANRGSRLAQKTLAYEVTKLVHGVDKANAVQKATEVLFGSGDFRSLGDLDIELVKAELVNETAISSDRIAELLVRAGLASSNGEAMRFISSGAVSVNGHPVSDPQASPLQPGDNLVKRGKNQFAIITLR